MRSTKIPEGVTYIGQFAFEGCTGLTGIEIPASVTIIVGDAFTGCSNLKDIKVAEDNKVYDSRGGCNAVIKTEYKSLVVGGISTVIPNDVTEIGSYAFAGRSGLTAIEIPSSVTRIRDYAFKGCTGLTGIVIPEGVTRIDTAAFQDCTGLTSVKLPNSLDSYFYDTVGGGQFIGCDNITSIELNGMIFHSYSEFKDYSYTWLYGE